MSASPERPVVGLTSSTYERAQPYADLIERSGGHPRVVLSDDRTPPDETISRLGGMLICGGADVHPRRYGREPEAGVELVLDESRDGMELSLLAKALESDVPTLCIGRGMQVLNVALGGALIQDIPGHSANLANLEGDGCVSAYHRIYISPGSKLAAIVGSGGFVRVNSRHHQGLREAQKSPLLLASAYSLDDGVIEALESPDHRWVVGVQFHPERRGEMPPHFDRLFQSLVDRALERTIARISR